jgi:hypothetical protein
MDQYGVQAALRQRQMSDLLRKKAEEGVPEGKMVGKHYVAPSWSQQLAPLANSFASVYADTRAGAAEAESSGKIEEARKKWSSSLPQATAAEYGAPTLEGLGGRERMGEAPVVKEAVPLTNQRIMQHASEGMLIPGNEKMAQLYATGAQADMAREDNQIERKENRASADLAAQRKQQEDLLFKREMLAKEMEKAGADRASRESIAEAQRQNTLLIAQGQQGIQRIMAEAKLEKAKGGDKLDHLPAAQTTAWIGNKTALGNIDETLKLLEAHPNAVGLKGMLPDAVLGRQGTEGEKAARASIANIGSMKIHDRSGATVTVGEEPRLKPFIPDIRDPLITVQRKLRGLKREAEKNNMTIEEFASGSGYMSPGKTTLTPDEVLDVGGAAPGQSAGGQVTPAVPAAPAAGGNKKVKFGAL